MKHTRHQSGNGIYHHDRRRLPARQHKISQRHIVRHHLLQNPLVNAFVVYDAYKYVLAGTGGRKVRTIYLTPQGRTFHQGMAEELAKEEDLIFLCGHVPTWMPSSVYTFVSIKSAIKYSSCPSFTASLRSTYKFFCLYFTRGSGYEDGYGRYTEGRRDYFHARRQGRGKGISISDAAT